ncbi:hypothetical protein D5F11_023010 [Siminovitchia terrae]|uniref:Uncharacterized protein n=1 Tax=Siminovitchia terrae TaxID=1914933 RepID=A0A429X1S4_SIMTE|nr:hypothetical protein [Siminovitchia terrae]RST57382.1 hypothetical protein D5F11_023010 [Siminovitchia terrae]
MDKTKIIGIVAMVVVLIFAVVALIKGKEEPEVQEEPKKQAEVVKEEPADELPTKIPDKKVTPTVEKDEKKGKKEVENEKERAAEQPTEPDFEDEFIKKFGNEPVDQARITVAKAMAIWVLDETNEVEWQPYATEHFYKKAIEDIQISKDDKKRDISNLEIFATEPKNDNEMRFVIFADWQLLDGVKTVSTQRKMYYADVVKVDDKWLVNEIEGLDRVFSDK